jgi:hypothetical protein
LGHLILHRLRHSRRCALVVNNPLKADLFIVPIYALRDVVAETGQNILRTFSEHSRNFRRTLAKLSRNIRRTFVELSENFLRTFSDHSRIFHSLSLDSLSFRPAAARTAPKPTFYLPNSPTFYFFGRPEQA